MQELVVEELSRQGDIRDANVPTSHAGEETSNKDAVDNAYDDEFPDDDDEGDEREKAISWKDLPIHVWYRIEIKRDIKTSYGPTKLLTLRDRNNTRFLVWATSLITSSIDSKWEEKGPGKLFIFTMAKRKSGSSKFSYFDYKYKILKK